MKRLATSDYSLVTDLGSRLTWKGDGCSPAVLVRIGLCSLAVSVFSLPAVATPQLPILRNYEGTASSEQVGRSGGLIGDVDADGFDEIVVAAPGAIEPPPFGAPFAVGSVRVYSGQTGVLLYEIFGPQISGTGYAQTAVGVGDYNMDGVPDFAVGAPGDMMGNEIFDRGSVTVYSGDDGSQIAKIWGPGADDNFGQSLSGAGDVNNDGFDDLLVGSSPAGFSIQSVRVISGADDSVLYTFSGLIFSDQFGDAVDGAGDVNGDGFDDVIIGAPSHRIALGNEPGRAVIFSGADGSTLYDILGDNDGDRFGNWVSGAGDVNLDGTPDFVVGAPDDDNNGADSGNVRVYDGTNGAVIYDNDGAAAGDRFGVMARFVGDPTGDNRTDWAVLNGNGGIQVFSGADGVGGVEFFPLLPPLFNAFIAPAGDVNGDGFDDIYGGHRLAGTGGLVNNGRAQVYSGFPSVNFTNTCNGDGGDQNGCTDCPCMNNAPQGTIGGCLNSAGTSATLLVEGDTSISLPSGSVTDLAFDLTGAPPSTTCLLTSGDAVAPQNMANPCFGFSSGVLSPGIYDGLRCAVQMVIRHGARQSDAGGDVGATNAGWGGPDAPADGIAAVAGFAAGQVRYFQATNRDLIPTSPCPMGTGQNSSQAIQVVFTP